MSGTAILQRRYSLHGYLSRLILEKLGRIIVPNGFYRRYNNWTDYPLLSEWNEIAWAPITIPEMLHKQISRRKGFVRARKNTNRPVGDIATIPLNDHCYSIISSLLTSPYASSG